MKKYNDIMIISSDVYLTINSMNNKGWKELKPSSINRILYLTAVFYSFLHGTEPNIFENNYKFTITLSGPEDPNVEKALVNLLANEAIGHNDEGYYIQNPDYIASFENYTHFADKVKWIDDISYIIGIYGEEKIYDFVFRDPQYQNSLKTNDLHSLDLSKENETVKFLEQFKREFEQHMKDDEKLSNRRYLELYFEYIFGKILRGDV